VRVLLGVKEALGEDIDIKYLQKRAKAERVEEVLEEVLKGSG